MMKFIIYSTGDHNPDQPPHPRAVVERVEYETSDGYQYRVWSIEINTLDELVAIRADVGHDLILTDTPDGEIAIEIYDSYRE